MNFEDGLNSVYVITLPERDKVQDFHIGKALVAFHIQAGTSLEIGGYLNHDLKFTPIHKFEDLHPKVLKHYVEQYQENEKLCPLKPSMKSFVKKEAPSTYDLFATFVLN